MGLINKNLSSLRDQSATYRWAYYTPNPFALKEIANLVDNGKVSWGDTQMFLAKFMVGRPLLS
jgi:hypothetical protein